MTTDKTAEDIALEKFLESPLHDEVDRDAQKGDSVSTLLRKYRDRVTDFIQRNSDFDYQNATEIAIAAIDEVHECADDV